MWDLSKESDIINMWSVGLKVVRGEANLVLQEEKIKMSLCYSQREFEKNSHSHCECSEMTGWQWQWDGMHYREQQQKDSMCQLIDSKQ